MANRDKRIIEEIGMDIVWLQRCKESLEKNQKLVASAYMEEIYKSIKYLNMEIPRSITEGEDD